TGNIALGDYYYNRGDAGRAEFYYLHALRIDSLANYARLNLSSVYNAGGQKEKFYYNYALFSQQQGKPRKAEGLYLEGLKRYPYSEQLNYGAAYFYIQSGQPEKATACIRMLKQLNPSNPDYTEIFR